MCPVRVDNLPEPESNLLNLNLLSGPKFSAFSGPNRRSSSRFSKILREPDRPEPQHHYPEHGVTQSSPITSLMLVIGQEASMSSRTDSVDTSSTCHVNLKMVMNVQWTVSANWEARTGLANDIFHVQTTQPES